MFFGGDCKQRAKHILSISHYYTLQGCFTGNEDEQGLFEKKSHITNMKYFTEIHFFCSDVNINVKTNDPSCAAVFLRAAFCNSRRTKSTGKNDISFPAKTLEKFPSHTQLQTRVFSSLFPFFSKTQPGCVRLLLTAEQRSDPGDTIQSR